MIDPHATLAAGALDRGNPTRALEHLSQVSNLTNPVVFVLRTRALLGLDRAEEAEQMARQGLALDPDNVELQLALASAMADQGREADAERSLLSVLNRHPEHLPALTRYAALLVNNGDPQGAREVVARIPDWHRASSPGMAGIEGYIAMIEGKSSEARAHLDRGLAMDPELANTQIIASLQAELSSRPTAAADHALGAARLDPDKAADLGREALYMKHPLMTPVRVFTRFGGGPIWIAWIALVYGGDRFLPKAVHISLIIGYIALAAYTWVVPGLLQRWLTRQGRL